MLDRLLEYVLLGKINVWPFNHIASNTTGRGSTDSESDGNRQTRMVVVGRKNVQQELVASRNTFSICRRRNGQVAIGLQGILYYLLLRTNAQEAKHTYIIHPWPSKNGHSVHLPNKSC